MTWLVVVKPDQNKKLKWKNFGNIPWTGLWKPLGMQSSWQIPDEKFIYFVLLEVMYRFYMDYWFN